MELKELQEDIKAGIWSEKIAKYIESLYDDTARHNLKNHRDWYVYDRFTRWDHWIIFNKTTNKVQTIPLSSWEVRRTVNKIRTQVRGVKNFIKRNQPTWICSPKDSEDESVEESIKYNDILRDFYEKKNFKRLMTQQVSNSLKYSLWILEWALVRNWDKVTLDFWINDTFDIFIDPLSTMVDLSDARFVIKAVAKSVTSLKWNKKYTIEGDLTPDNKSWASAYKDILEKEKNGNESIASSKDLETCILKEFWYKYYWENWVVVKKITVAWGKVIHSEVTDYQRIPMFLYNPEMEAGKIYSDPWIKDLISPNKSLDKIASQVESYIQRMLSGKFLIKQGTEVSTITDKWAEKIYWKGQNAPSQLNLQPLPSAPFSYMESLERWIEEFGWVREASLGRAPGSLQSGKGLEALQAADAWVVSEPVENLELMLADVGRFIIETLSRNQNTTNLITTNKKTIKYIGNTEWAKWLKSEDEDLLILEPKEIKVRIAPEIAYTEEAKRELIFKLAEAEIIDPETLLEYLNVSNVSDIITRVRKIKEESYKEEMMKQKASHATSWEWATDSATLADQENMSMSAGQDVPATPRALWTPEHTQLHEAFARENMDISEESKQMFAKHLQQELQYLESNNQ